MPCPAATSASSAASARRPGRQDPGRRDALPERPPELALVVVAGLDADRRRVEPDEQQPVAQRRQVRERLGRPPVDRHRHAMRTRSGPVGEVGQVVGRHASLPPVVAAAACRRAPLRTTSDGGSASRTRSRRAPRRCSAKTLPDGHGREVEEQDHRDDVDAHSSHARPARTSSPTTIVSTMRAYWMQQRLGAGGRHGGPAATRAPAPRSGDAHDDRGWPPRPRPWPGAAAARARDTSNRRARPRAW